MIESRVAVHDSNHVEIKLDYAAPANENATYRVDGYFFVPRNLGVSKYSYSAEQFYSDVQGYVRFKTPRVRLAQLVEDRPDSLLALIRSATELAVAQSGSESSVRRLEYQLKMFGCVARANIRDRATELHEDLPHLADSGESEGRAPTQAESAGRLLDDIDLTFPRFRATSRLLEQPELPRRVRETYAMVDEYLSLVLELRLTSLLLELERPSLQSYDWGGLRGRLVAKITEERVHRLAAGYADTSHVGTGNELLVFRLGMLKKFVYSVLWLEINKAKEGVGAANVGAAFAAGAAMFVAVVATLFHARWFALNSWGFIFAATLTYVLKDRLKDLLKLTFSRATGRWAYDYSVDITDPLQGRKVGHCREAFSYVPVRNVPAEVYAFRRVTDQVSIESEARPEVVLRYSKLVRLNAGAMGPARSHLEAYELNDIIRLSLRQFLSRADDSKSMTPLYDEERGRAVETELRKVYHINLVLAYRATHETQSTMRRLRIVFDKQAVRRIVELKPDGNVLSPGQTFVPNSSRPDETR